MLGVLKQKPLEVPGRFTLPFLPADCRRIAVPYDGIKDFALFSIFFDFFRVEKNVEKNDRQKATFFALICDFGSPRRRFFEIFGPKTGPRGLRFRCFFENGDFVKIVLPL